ncbi:CpaF family protein [Halalkalibacter alkaliphilus]|uniref:CpaF family protein n=1 Tax=Halalkalibacter alkaliphilus TaxID=2917993 RepID=A0A9X2CPX9_9BACI|nr:CpaF family protein [Halalkalibacter alkaliphilus]MCL7746727.1 CpaF family protein [Halalkalibacter alkaliphilus]
MSLLKRLNEKSLSSSATEGRQDSSTPQKREGTRPKDSELKIALQSHLISELKKKPDLTDEEQKELIEAEATKFFNEKNDRLSFEGKKELTDAVTHELIGYGPITALLNDPNVSEIMVNGPYQIYVEKKGKLVLSDYYFRDNDHILQVIEKIVSPLGRRIDESSPMVDARLPDGSRVNAIIPPLSLVGPTITIRKFPQNRLQIADLVGFGSLTEEMAQFLDACVKARLNIFISGGTGSGKTSLLNVLSSFIPDDERIVTIEDAAELQLGQDHVVSLETRPPNIEGKGAVTIRDLVKNSLRMRPDRVVIGEVRSGEALDMLQAMNTGHDGSLATGHSNSPREMLSRLETMVLMAGMDLPIRAIREQIAGAVDLIIQQSRLKDGSRKVVKITEVIGMEGETIVLQDLFTFNQTGTTAEGKVIGNHGSTGIRPYCSEKLERYGFELPAEWFNGDN